MSGGIYVLVGPDRYRKRERVKELERSLKIHPLDRHQTSAAELSPSSLRGLIREHPAASPVRFILIEEADRLSEPCLDTLKHHAEGLRDIACVVLTIETEGRARPALTSLTRLCIVEQFAWLSSQQVTQWIVRDVARANKQIAPAAIQALLHMYGADLEGIHTLLDQVFTSIGPQPQLSFADLQAFLPRRPSSSDTFALVKAVAGRNPAAAMQALHEHLRNGTEVLELLGLLAWQLQRWVWIGRLIQAGMSREQISTLAGVQPWQLDRIVTELADRPLPTLTDALTHCWQVDVAAKRGALPLPRAALEQLVIECCRIGQPVTTARQAE